MIHTKFKLFYSMIFVPSFRGRRKTPKKRVSKIVIPKKSRKTRNVYLNIFKLSQYYAQFQIPGIFHCPPLSFSVINNIINFACPFIDHFRQHTTLGNLSLWIITEHSQCLNMHAIWYLEVHWREYVYIQIFCNLL